MGGAELGLQRVWLLWVGLQWVGLLWVGQGGAQSRIEVGVEPPKVGHHVSAFIGSGRKLGVAKAAHWAMRG